MNKEQQIAYEWAKKQTFSSVAARYAKMLTEVIDEQTSEILALKQEDERLKAERVWISSYDKLPSENGRYLVVINRTAPEELGGDSTDIKILRIIDGEWRYGRHIPEWINNVIKDEVMLWQRLPEPPKEGGKDDDK